MKYTGEYKIRIIRMHGKNYAKIGLKYAMCVFRHFQYPKYAQYASICTDPFADADYGLYMPW